MACFIIQLLFLFLKLYPEHIPARFEIEDLPGESIDPMLDICDLLIRV